MKTIIEYETAPCCGRAVIRTEHPERRCSWCGASLRRVGGQLAIESTPPIETAAEIKARDAAIQELSR